LKIKKNKLQGKNNSLVKGLKKNQSMRTKLEKKKKHNKLGLNNEIENNQNLDKKARKKNKK
jgi:hypothetical protein